MTNEPLWMPDRLISNNGSKFIYLDQYNPDIPKVRIATADNYKIANEFVRLWNEARDPAREELYHDEETLNKVLRALLRKHYDYDDATLIISEIQNAGILFRERSRE
jgi:SOS response regulatory protein OraA/RecX